MGLWFEKGAGKRMDIVAMPPPEKYEVRVGKTVVATVLYADGVETAMALLHCYPGGKLYRMPDDKLLAVQTMDRPRVPLEAQ